MGNKVRKHEEEVLTRENGLKELGNGLASAKERDLGKKKRT